MFDIKTFIDRMNDIENSPKIAKDIIFASNTDIDIVAKILVSTMYSISDSTTPAGINRDVAEQLLDFLDAVIWSFAEICDDGCTPQRILNRSQDLHNAVYDYYIQD